jgi:Protein of unknown function
VRRKVLKFGLLTILLVFALVALGVAAFLWRINQGPISVSFLNSRIEAAVNDQLKDMKVTLGGAILEVDSKTSTPHLRFRNLVLTDTAGYVIASSPRAAVTLDSAALLTGKITTRGLELIGPKISARRNVDGSVELGVVGEEQEANEPASAVPSPQSTDGKTDQNAATAIPQSNGAKLIALLDAREGSDSLSTLQDIRITDASLTLFDDANSANWVAPKVDLTFRKMPYGFVVLAKADVASNGEPWHTEFSIAYKHDTKTFNVSSTVDNLVLANVAEKIFALSQFAKIKLPLSGHIDFDANENGVISKANAELMAAAGRLDFPDYLAQPIDVDDGTLRASYDAAVGTIDISNSSIRVGGERADISGKVLPIRTPDGKLTALNINMVAKNVSLEQEGADKKPVLVDRIEFSGRAAIDQARLDIDDLVIMSANTGVRMRGIITGGEESVGIQLAGRVRDISATFLKKLWPPIVAPNARTWVAENVISGRVTEGTFQANFPPGALTKAWKELRLADNSVELNFKLNDVSTRFFKNLPPLVKAAGVAHLKDNDFDLAINGGQMKSDTGRIVTLSKGSFIAHDIAKYEVQGVFAFDLQASVDAMLELANQPDVGLAKTDLSKLPKVQGTAHAAVGLKIPLINEIPKDRIELTTDISLSNAALAGVVPGIDVTDGEFAITISKDEISVSGPAKVNGLPAKVDWKKTSTDANPSARISLILDENETHRIYFW